MWMIQGISRIVDRSSSNLGIKVVLAGEARLSSGAKPQAGRANQDTVGWACSPARGAVHGAVGPSSLRGQLKLGLVQEAKPGITEQVLC